MFIPAIPKRRRTRLVRPSHELRELDDGDTNVFMHGLIDRYAVCPAGQPFDNMTLAHFAVWYNTVSGTYNEGENSNDSASRLPRFQQPENYCTKKAPSLLESSNNDTRIPWR